MKDKIDFTKIIVDGDFIAAINFSRMIPVEDGQLSKVDTKIRKHDNARFRERKTLLSKKHANSLTSKRSIKNECIYRYFRSVKIKTQYGADKDVCVSVLER